MLDFARLTTRQEKALFVLFATATLACASALISQLGASFFFLFEIYLSLLPQVLLFAVLVVIAALFWQPRFAAGLAALTFLAATPFLFFSKYETPSGAECGPGECFKILTINLWSESDYLPALAELIKEYDIDILAINESSVDTIDPNFEDVYFAQYDTVVHATWLNMPRGMGNPISFMSREPVADVVRILNADTGKRAYISADLAEQWSGIRIVVAHAMTPTSPSGLSQRNALLEDVSEVSRQSDSFILLGDFNMTPWSPEFSKLPGKRAGDPRFSMTWPSIFPPLGMSIDHIMFSDDLELVQYDILRSIGSDHYPVMATFKRKDR